MEEIQIYGDFIQLDQFLKKTDRISSGGETGAYLEAHKVTEKRKKLRAGDMLKIDGDEYKLTGA